MRKSSIALVIACLASLGHGQQVEASDEGLQSSPSTALMTLLLASNPELAFNPSSAGVRLPVGKPTVAAPIMAAKVVEATDEELKKSLEKRIAQLGIAHPDTIDSKYALAMSLANSGELKPAEEMLREVTEAYTNVLGFDAPDTLTASDSLADILAALGDTKGAQDIEDETTKLRSRRCIDGKRGTQYWTKIARYSRQVGVVKKTLQDSFVIFALPAAGLSVPLMSDLRNAMPEGTRVNVVKNRLFKRALKDFPGFAAVDPLLKEPRMWVFCTEDSFRPTLEAVKKWQTDSKKLETHPILGGGMDGALYDSEGIEALSKLPSRQDLMQKVAVAINSVPTKLARGVKAVPTKLARGLKAASGEKLARGLAQVEEKGKEKGISTLGDI